MSVFNHEWETRHKRNREMKIWPKRYFFFMWLGIMGWTALSIWILIELIREVLK